MSKEIQIKDLKSRMGFALTYSDKNIIDGLDSMESALARALLEVRSTREALGNTTSQYERVQRFTGCYQQFIQTTNDIGLITKVASATQHCTEARTLEYQLAQLEEDEA